MPWNRSQRRYGRNLRAKPQWDEHGHYDSKAEQERFYFLRILEKAGDISGLELHPSKVVLIPAGIDAPEISFRPDYLYTEDGRLIYEDCKPRPMNPKENLIFKLWAHFGPAPLRISARKGKSGWIIKKTIHGRRVVE